MNAIPSVLTAMVTPFADGHLDEPGFRNNIRYQIQEGMQGILVLGTTGERPTLTRSEQERVIQIAIEEGKGRVHVMVGTGTNATETTIENTQQAEEMGADSVLVVTPYYNKPTPSGLLRHFEALASKTLLPIVVYNNPSRTGQNITPDILTTLAEVPSIAGVKESSGNIGQIGEFIERLCHDPVRPFSVHSGDDYMTLPLMALGGHGTISVISNLVPRLVVEMVDAALNGRLEEARHYHYRLLPLCRAAFIESNPMPIKAAMAMAGMAAGGCRLPLNELQSSSRRHIAEVLAEMDLLNRDVLGVSPLQQV